ncbi:MAG: DUF1543 domain-containing protein [Bdellovibrionales bacterium]
MKLYMVHCGFYDEAMGEGLYESHMNFFVAAESFEDARLRVKQLPAFKVRRMHVDGLQEIQAVNGYKVSLLQVPELGEETILLNMKHRDLAPKPAPTSV